MGKRYDLESEIMRQLSDYTAEIAEEIEKTAVRLGKEAARTLKDTSPRSGKKHRHYADGWTVRRSKSGGVLTVTVYNRIKPHLTHLIEFGHLKANGVRVRGKEHIYPVQEKLNRDFEAACEEIVRNGG